MSTWLLKDLHSPPETDRGFFRLCSPHPPAAQNLCIVNEHIFEKWLNKRAEQQQIKGSKDAPEVENGEKNNYLVPRNEKKLGEKDRDLSVKNNRRTGSRLTPTVLGPSHSGTLNSLLLGVARVLIRSSAHIPLVLSRTGTCEIPMEKFNQAWLTRGTNPT